MKTSPQSSRRGGGSLTAYHSWISFPGREVWPARSGRTAPLSGTGPAGRRAQSGRLFFHSRPAIYTELMWIPAAAGGPGRSRVQVCHRPARLLNSIDENKQIGLCRRRAQSNTIIIGSEGLGKSL